MPILDLAGAAPLFPRKTGKRTLGAPGTLPAGLLSGSAAGQGGFAAAKRTRLNADLDSRSRSADQDLYGDNLRLRGIARNLAINSPFGRKFLQMVKQNVIGEAGILLKSTVRSVNGKDTDQTAYINKRIDDEWKKWSRRGRCTACGRFSLADLQLQAIANIAREGENLVKFAYGRQFNETGFALQPLDNDQLDDSMMQQLADNAEIRMGVEVDQYRRPLAYHLWGGHPFDLMGNRNRERKRIPASEIVHTAVFERPGQTRGYTWMTAAILAMNQYNRYDEAVVVAARNAASSFATIESQVAEGSFADDEDEDGDNTNGDGTEYRSVEAGEMMRLAPGETLNYTDPRFPTNTHKEYTQTVLRNIASGLLVMYPSLANDLEGVNFSSIRAGLIDERDMWRIVQRWFAECFLGPIRMGWLRMALLTTLSDITLTPDQMEQYSARGRGWDWVDPAKDAQAIILKLGEGLTTYEIECSKLGHDWMELAQQRKREQDYFASIGVVYGVDITGDQGGKGVAAGDEKEASEVAGAKNSADSVQVANRKAANDGSL